MMISNSYIDITIIFSTSTLITLMIFYYVYRVSMKKYTRFITIEGEIINLSDAHKYHVWLRESHNYETSGKLEFSSRSHFWLVHGENKTKEVDAWFKEIRWSKRKGLDTEEKSTLFKLMWL